MNHESIRKNMVNLRNSKNLTTAQVAMILGIQPDLYEKMELGFEETTYEVLSGLSKFYGVDVSVFSQNQVITEPRAERVSTKVVTTYGKTSKIWEVLSLIASALMFVFYLFLPYGHFFASIFGYEFSGDPTFVMLFNGNSAGICVAVFMLLFIIYLITNSIIWATSDKLKQNLYGKISGILNIVSTVLILALFVYVVTEVMVTIGTLIIGFVIILLTVFEIVSFVRRNKLKK